MKCILDFTMKLKTNAYLDGWARHQMSALAKEMVLVLSGPNATIFSAM